jgi:hypothetical protein
VSVVLRAFSNQPSDPLHLLRPCDGSPFARIFKDPAYLPLAPEQATNEETYCVWQGAAKLPPP